MTNSLDASLRKDLVCRASFTRLPCTPGCGRARGLLLPFATPASYHWDAVGNLTRITCESDGVLDVYVDPGAGSDGETGSSGSRNQKNWEFDP